MPPSSRRSSRRRFAEYLENRRKRAAELKAAGVIDAGWGQSDKPIKKRGRSFFRLFAQFWGLLGEHRWKVIASLATLSVAALLGLLLPAGIKPAIDYILSERPGPAGIPRWIPVPDWARVDTPEHRHALLWMLGGFLITVTA